MFTLLWRLSFRATNLPFMPTARGKGRASLKEGELVTRALFGEPEDRAPQLDSRLADRTGWPKGFAMRNSSKPQ